MKGTAVELNAQTVSEILDPVLADEDLSRYIFNAQCASIRDRSRLETDQSVRSRLVYKNIYLRFSIHEKYSRESRYAGRSASIPQKFAGETLSTSMADMR